LISCIPTGSALSVFIYERIAAREYNSFAELVANFRKQDF